MASDVKDTEADRERATRAARAIASLSDPRDYAAVVRAVVASDPMTPQERSKRMGEALERLRELHRKTLEEIGEPLPNGYGAQMIREGRP